LRAFRKGRLNGARADARRHFLQRDDRLGKLLAELTLTLKPLRLQGRDDEHQGQKHGDRLGKK